MDAGYSANEIERAQQRFGLTFPPDLVDLLKEQRIPDGYDWVADDESIARALKWPLDGLLFDVEEAGLWWPEWGDRPRSQDDRALVVREVIESAPKLIPLMAHRYLPEEPNERGNPVFSVYQSDMIICGADLSDWLRVESDPTFNTRPARPTKGISFWSLAVERSGDPEFYTSA